jgi:acyl carrier protein
MNTTLERVNKVVRYVVPELQDDFAPTDQFTSDLEIDSLSIVEIMTNVEKEFGLAFEDDEVDGVESVQDILDIIQRRQ